MSLESENIYKKCVLDNFLRVLSFFDLDPTSPTYGIADRKYWGWKIIDFPDASFQRVVYGISLMLVNNIFPENVSKKKILRIIDAGLIGLDKISRTNGSVDQAFPFESSYGATTFVALDVLSAIILIEDLISQEQKNKYTQILRPLVYFVKHNNESHGFISNHLAAAALLMYKWEAWTGEATSYEGLSILKKILKNQSESGWFLEYEGADPGYMSLCLHYLTDLYFLEPSSSLKSAIQRGLSFLSYCAHPDGSFGGYYGSRNTKFYFPSCAERMSSIDDNAYSLSRYMRTSIKKDLVVTINTVDLQNLIPMFNYYSYSAVHFSTNERDVVAKKLPAFSDNISQHFEDVGLLIFGSRYSYTIINYFKGGVVYYFDKNNNKKIIDCGALYADKRNNLFTTQCYEIKNIMYRSGSVIEIYADLIEINKIYPTPSKFLILRIFNLSFMRVRFFLDAIKKILVYVLITKKNKTKYKNKRSINLFPDFFVIDEPNSKDLKSHQKGDSCVFSSIHMASQGYVTSLDLYD